MEGEHGGMYRQNTDDFYGSKMLCVCSVAKLCLTHDPMDWSLLGISVSGILRARVLEWVAISYSRDSSPTQGSHPHFLLGRQVLYHWATRQAPHVIINLSKGKKMHITMSKQ